MPFDSCRFDTYYDHSDPNYTGTGRFDYELPLVSVIARIIINYAKELNVAARTIAESNSCPYSISMTHDAAD